MSIRQNAFDALRAHFEETGEVLSAKTIAEQFDTVKTYAAEVIRKWKKAYNEDVSHGKSGRATTGNRRDKVETDYRGDRGDININSLTIQTLDDALLAAKVDLDVWDVDRYQINSWQTPMKITKKEMDSFAKDNVEFFVEETAELEEADEFLVDGLDVDGNLVTIKTKKKPIKLSNRRARSYHDEIPVQVTNFQVKVWLKRKTPDVYEEAIKQLIETVPAISPMAVPTTIDTANSDVAVEVCLYDAHFGKFAWHPETLMGNWDISICTDAYLGGCREGLANSAPFRPSKIFFVLGQDFMHVDNSFFKTPHGGHSLDADGRFPKIARKAMETVIEAIAMCRSVAPVDVKWVPGNHDLHASFWLSLILEQAFRDDPYVTVDNSPCQRKAELWGDLLVGWWHDASGRKMPASVNALAQFWPELWGQSKFRELHVGHKHKKVHVKTMPIETTGGVLIRQIPSLSSIDFWHQEQLFVDAIPASETLLWSKDNGVFGNFTINVKPTVD
jgi:hypothetical protein